MNKMSAILTVVALVAPLSNAHSQSPQHSFNFNAESVSGFPSGEVRITGGGTFDPAALVVNGHGSFRCLRDINQGPLAGLKAGEGVKWDSDEILPSFDIKCTGAETPRTVVTDANTVVMKAEFYRAGDGNVASLHAVMFVSTNDQDGGQSGVQTVWIQGVGCGEALAHIN